MSDKLLDIAKANGADLVEPYTSVMSKREMLTMTPDQLRATIEQVCAPQIRALEMGQEVIKGLMDMYLKNKDAVSAAYWHDFWNENAKILANYLTLIGDKE